MKFLKRVLTGMTHIILTTLLVYNWNSQSMTLFFLFTLHIYSKDGSRNNPRGIKCLQTDDILTICNNTFLTIEQKESSGYSCKTRKKLCFEKPIRFNRAKTNNVEHAYTLCYNRQFRSLKTLNVVSFDKAEFVSQWTRGAYIAALYRPDLTYFFTSAAQVTGSSL